MALSPTALYTNFLIDVASIDVDVASPRSVAVQQMSQSLVKKFESDSDRIRLEQSAFDRLRASNAQCAALSLEDPGVFGFFHLVLGEMKTTLYSIFEKEPLDLNEILSLAKPGPGAAIEANGTDFYSKLFRSPISYCGDLAFELLTHWGCDNSPLQAALSTAVARYGVRSVPGSKGSTVPKNDSSRRTISIEPSANMLFQLGAGRALTGRLNRYFGIDLSSQPRRNASLARLGSIYNSFCTIDLKDASNSLSTVLCQRLLPPNEFRILSKLRSPQTRIHNDWLDLHLFATMGTVFVSRCKR